MSDPAAHVCSRCRFSFSGVPFGNLCPRCSLERVLDASGPVPDSERLEPGASVLGFECIERLGRGAMGEVWLAREVALDRIVALKFVAADGAGPARLPELAERLRREARAAAALSHPNILKIHAQIEWAGRPCLVLEFAEGGDLAARLRQHPLPAREAAIFGQCLASALHHAHATGILHRDVKPSNVLIGADGQPLLADFGLAAILEGGRDLTQTGQLAATPAYTAPEILEGQPPSALSDLYSLGALLYECLTGRPPFSGSNPAALLGAISREEPVPPDRLVAGLPGDLAQICLKCLEKNPSLRYASAGDLSQELQDFLDGRPIRARPVGPLGRGWRWSKRNKPLALALSGIAVLLAGSSVLSMIAAARIEAERRIAQGQALRAEQAEHATRLQLRDALIERARAVQLSGRSGQRESAVAALAEAARISPGPDLRDAAIAALTLPDVVRQRVWTAAEDQRHAILFHTPSDSHLVFAPSPGSTTFWQSSSEQQLSVWEEEPGAPVVGWPIFSPDGTRVALRTEEGRVSVRLTRSGKALWEIQNRPYPVSSTAPWYGFDLAFSPDGTRLTCALPDGGVSLHAVEDGTEIARNEKVERPTHIAWSPDGRELVIMLGVENPDGRARILDAASLLPVRDVEFGPFDGMPGLHWSPDGRWIAASMIDGARLRSAVDGKPGPSLPVPGGTVRQTLFSQEGDTALTSSSGGEVRWWSLRTGVQRLLLQDEGVMPLAANGDLTGVFKQAWAGDAHEFRMSESPLLRNLIPLGGLANATWSPCGLAFSPDGSQLLVCVFGSATRFDVEQGKAVSSMLGEPGDEFTAFWEPGGRGLLMLAGGSGLVRLTDAEASRFPREDLLMSAPGFVLNDVSADGERIVMTAYSEGLVKVVDRQGSALASWSLETALDAALSPDGRFVVATPAASAAESPLHLRDAETGAIVRSLGTCAGGNVRWSPDGKRLLVSDGAITRLHNLADDTSVLIPWPEWSGAESSFAFAPDSRRAAFARTGRVALVDLDRLEILAHLEGREVSTGQIASLRFSPRGSHLAVLFTNGRTVLWDLQAVARELGNRGFSGAFVW